MFERRFFPHRKIHIQSLLTAHKKCSQHKIYQIKITLISFRRFKIQPKQRISRRIFKLWKMSTKAILNVDASSYPAFVSYSFVYLAEIKGKV